MRLEFAEGRLDRVEVWRIRWEVKQRRTHRFDRLPDASHFVGWKIIYDDDFAALEDRDNAASHKQETSAHSWHPQARTVRPWRAPAGRRQT